MQLFLEIQVKPNMMTNAENVTFFFYQHFPLVTSREGSAHQILQTVDLDSYDGWVLIMSDLNVHDSNLTYVKYSWSCWISYEWAFPQEDNIHNDELTLYRKHLLTSQTLAQNNGFPLGSYPAPIHVFAPTGPAPLTISGYATEKPQII